MSATTTPANPTDQIAAVVATPAAVQDAQQYGHDEAMEDLDSIEACEEVSECADGCCTYFTPRHAGECDRLAAYIERLEAERDALRNAVCLVVNDLMSYDDLPFLVSTYAVENRDMLAEDAAALGDAVSLLCAVAAEGVIRGADV